MEKEKKEKEVEKEVEKEEKTTKQKESKGIKTTSFQTTLIVILLICVAALGGWIVGASKVNVMYKEAINSKESSGENKTNNVSDNNTSDDTTTPEVKDEIKPLDLDNSLNSTGITYSNSRQLNEDNEVTGISVKRDGSTVKLVIDWPKFGPYSGASAWSDKAVEYEITGLSGNVKKAVVSGIGQDITGTKIFYLMEDGTVEYTNIFSRNFDSNGTLYFNVNYTYEKDSNGKITGEHFASQGRVNGVKDAIELYSASAIPTGSMIGGYGTTLAATKDGSFYDLDKGIEK